LLVWVTNTSTKKLLAATKRYGQHGWKSLSRDKQDEEYVKVMVGTVLLGWQGYPVEFSEAESYKDSARPVRSCVPRTD